MLGLLPALGLAPADGSERAALGRGRRDLGGGGARVGSLAAASLIVSMTDDSRLTIEGSGLASRGGSVGEAFEAT